MTNSTQSYVTRRLRNAETILAGHGLPVITPTDFIIHLDELHRGIEYQPARLAGSQIQIGRVRSGQEVIISSEFQSPQQETKRAFQQRLNLLFADPRNVQTEIVTDIDQQPLALISFDRRIPLQLTIPVLRLKHNPLSATLCRKLVLRAIDIAVEERLHIIVISDTVLAEEVQQTLHDLGFFYTGQHWLRIVLQVVGRTAELITSIQELSRLLVGETNTLLALGHDLESVLAASAPEQQIEVEQRLRPVKITDIDVPTYIVPIRPYWAMHLFDEGIAQQDMFGAKPDLALSGENVYYRSSRPAVVSAPARILWYVSNDSRYSGVKHIRACSYLNEVICGKPKVLFKRFHRLGIYEWKQVLETARGDPNSEIMAMGFSGTELFKRPIAWHEVQRMLQEIEGRVSQIQSPVRVSQEYFVRIYQAGMNNTAVG